MELLYKYYLNDQIYDATVDVDPEEWNDMDEDARRDFLFDDVVDQLTESLTIDEDSLTTELTEEDDD